MTGILSPELERVVEQLVGKERTQISLDEVADAIGTHPVTVPEIDRLFDALESAGVEVVSPPEGHVREDLGKVLSTARAMGSELGRRPTLAELASRTGLDLESVRAALLYARVLAG